MKKHGERQRNRTRSDIAQPLDGAAGGPRGRAGDLLCRQPRPRPGAGRQHELAPPHLQRGQRQGRPQARPAPAPPQDALRPHHRGAAPHPDDQGSGIQH